MVERDDSNLSDPAQAEVPLIAARLGGLVRYSDHLIALAHARVEEGRRWLDLVDNLVGFLKDAGELQPFGGTLGGEVVDGWDRARLELIEQIEGLTRKLRGGEV